MRHQGSHTYYVRIVLVALAYFLSGKLGFAIAYIGSQITLFWLPTGVAVAALYRWGSRCWPAVFIGAFFVNLSIGATYPLAFGIAIGNTLAPLLAVWLLRRGGFNETFNRASDVPLFCLIAFVSMLLSALNGVYMLWAEDILSPDKLLASFMSWWLGDSVGVLLSGPLLLTVTRKNLSYFLPRSTEFLFWCSAMALLNWFVFSSNSGEIEMPLAFLSLPLIVWAALRFGVAGASFAVITQSFFAALFTSWNYGPFARFEKQGLFILWAFMSTLVLVALMIESLLALRKQAEERANILLASINHGVWGLDLSGNTTFVNGSATRMLGYKQDELLGKPMHSIVHYSNPDGTAYPKENCPMNKTLSDGVARTIGDEVLWRKDGSYFPVEYGSHPIYQDEILIGAVVVFHDITERKKSQEEIRIAAAAFETHEAIMITDANANIIRVNQAFQNITGYSAEDVIGENTRILSSGRHDKAFYMGMWKQLLELGIWSGEIWDKRKNGQIYPKWLTITAVKDNAGKTSEYVAIFSDITSRKAAEDKIYSLAYYDILTSLPNRRYLLDRLKQAQSASARSNHYGALLFLDMDRFKMLNDTLGHDNGDLFLIEIARRLQQCVREVDAVARIGGDEFVVLLEELDPNPENASQRVALIAEKIRASLSSPYQIGEHEHHSSPSIGVSLYRGNDMPLESILKHADMAMYQAKEAGRNAVRFFDPAMQLAVETRASLEADLRHAVPEKQLRMFYQIQLNSDLKPLGAEALIRWFHPVRGMVSPAQFIPIAEDSSLILEIGRWVLESACKQLAQWSKQEHTRELTLAVNVSAAQFKKLDFVDTVTTLVNIYQVNPICLKLELTEGVVLSNIGDVITKMHLLKALGVRLSLDDFGTGYSSLSYLKQLPLDQIKIDQSFVRDITTDPNDAVMVQTIINLANNFRLNVIAEGVETEAQLKFLKENGCMSYQGYLFSKPIPIEELEALLNQS